MESISKFDFGEIDLGGTPTLMLLDNEKRVLEVWKGKLDEAQEKTVLEKISRAY